MNYYRFEKTCEACPEQYDVWDDSKNLKVGYVRMRWGYLRVCPYKPEKFEGISELTGKKYIDQEIDWDITLYEYSVEDGLLGIIPDNERNKILDEIDEAIYKFWSEGKYINKDEYNIYINLDDIDNVEDVTEEWI